MSKKKKQKSGERRGNPPGELSPSWHMLRSGPPSERLLPHWPRMGFQFAIEDEVEEEHALAVDIEEAKHLVNRLTEAIARAEERRK
jgi:hypothetical protein